MTFVPVAVTDRTFGHIVGDIRSIFCNVPLQIEALSANGEEQVFGDLVLTPENVRTSEKHITLFFSDTVQFYFFRSDNLYFQWVTEKEVKLWIDPKPLEGHHIYRQITVRIV